MNVLLVDDHSLIREALRGVIAELRPRANVIEAASKRTAIDALHGNAGISLVLLDLNLPDSEGLGFLRELRSQHPATAVVVLSALNTPENVVAALDEGAQGFIPKSASRELMIGALQLVLSGGVYIPPEALGAAAKSAGSGSAAMSRLNLSDRQAEVLALMMQGNSNKVICRKLGLAEPTVKNHVTAILKSLKASNRTEAVIAAAAMGLTFPEDWKA